jgi:hypothetical protein
MSCPAVLFLDPSLPGRQGAMHQCSSSSSRKRGGLRLVSSAKEGRIAAGISDCLALTIPISSESVLHTRLGTGSYPSHLISFRRTVSQSSVSHIGKVSVRQEPASHPILQLYKRKGSSDRSYADLESHFILAAQIFSSRSLLCSILTSRKDGPIR